MNKTTVPLLIIVTGSKGSGKTTFCTILVDKARQAGWKPAGILSHAVFEGERRTAICIEDVSNHEKRRLAVYSEDDPTPGSRYWKFDPESVAWGNLVFNTSTPSDLLVVDELGPLEFERNAGWQSALTAIDSHRFAVGLVVIRAELLGEAILRWPDANLVEIDTLDESSYKAKVISQQLF